MPLNETLTDGLDTYGVGQKIRDLRLGKKLGLVELGRHTGLSAALLSKIERGKMYPTLPTLLRYRARVWGRSRLLLQPRQPSVRGGSS